jgi:hypothetical protein
MIGFIACLADRIRKISFAWIPTIPDRWARRGDQGSCPAPRHFPDEDLYAALDGLPEPYRLPLILFHFGRLTLEGTAEALACRPAIVRARLSRGRAMLRARLGRRGIRIADAAVGAWLDDAASPAAVPSGFVDAVVEAALRESTETD